MRKADYASLAENIKSHRESTHHASHYSQETREIVKDKLTSVAQRFARESSVDKVAFLKACGLS